MIDSQEIQDTTETLNATTREDLSSRTLLMIDLLLEQRRRLLKYLAVAALVSTAIAFLLPKRYEAVARLMPPDATPGMSSAMLGMLTAKAGDTIGAMASDALGLRATGATVVGVLQSRTIQDDLTNQFDLRKVYRTRYYQDARKVLSKRTAVSEDRKSGIITIAVQDSSPERATAMAKAYVDDLNSRISQLSTSAARREREFLESRLQSIKHELDESTLELSRFSSKNRTFDPAVQGKAMLEATASLQGQLIAAETELSGLRQIYTPENSRVRAASARVEELRSKLRNFAGARQSGSAGESRSANDEIYPSLEQLPLLGNTYYDLARRAKINEAVYEILTKQYELAKVQEAKETPSIKALDEPILPERKVWPPRTILIILGMMLGLALGMTRIIAGAAFERLPVEDSRRVLLSRLARPFLFVSRRSAGKHPGALETDF